MFNPEILELGLFYGFLYGLLFGLFTSMVKLFFMSPIERKTP